MGSGHCPFRTLLGLKYGDRERVGNVEKVFFAGISVRADFTMMTPALMTQAC